MTPHTPSFLATFWKVPGLCPWTSIFYLFLFPCAFIIMSLNSILKLMPSPNFITSLELSLVLLAHVFNYLFNISSRWLTGISDLTHPKLDF